MAAVHHPALGVRDKALKHNQQQNTSTKLMKNACLKDVKSGDDSETNRGKCLGMDLCRVIGTPRTKKSGQGRSAMVGLLMCCDLDNRVRRL